MSFVERRSEETRRYLFYFFVALGACVALITVVIAQLSWRGWVQGLRALLRGEGILRPARSAHGAGAAADRARRARLMRELERQYRPLDGSQRVWTQETLRAMLRGEMRGNDVIVVTNREPYIHVQHAGRHPRAASGERPRHRARARDARVLGHLDRARQRQRRSRDRRPPRPRRRAARAAALPDPPHLADAPRKSAGYYGGFANEGLWPLCHIAHVRPTFRAADWEQYRAVNAKFADAVVEEAQARTRSSSCRTITSRCCRA